MSTLKELCEQILYEKNNKIIPDKIKKDWKIFDILGTYEESGDSGNVKLFDTIEHMQADPNPQNEDLAIVYNSYIKNLEADDEFDSIIFPETVVLSEAVTSNISCRFTPVNSSGSSYSFSGTIRSSVATFSYTNYTDISDRFSVTYTSTDGKTYSRTDELGNPLHLGNIFKHNPNYTFYDIEGLFIKLNSYNYEGLFIYTNNQYQLAETQLNAEADYVYQKKFFGKNGAETGSLQKITELNIDEVTLRRTLRNLYSNMSVSNASNFFMNNSTLTSFNAETTVPDVVFENLNNTSKMFYRCTNLTSLSNFNTINVTNMSNMLSTCNNLTSVPNFDTSNVLDMSNMVASCSNLTTVPNFNTINVESMSDLFRYCKNLTTVPNFNTSNVKNMSYMFIECSKNLTSVPNFNTINVTNMYGIFRLCSSLQSAPDFDTSNVISMGSMFSGCGKLSSMKNYNTSNTTIMSNMFESCYNLTSVPNFDTSNVTNMKSMFADCNNLTTVPQFNTSNVTIMSNMFRFCNKLSSSSIQNIINMVLNSNITTPTYKNLNNTNSNSPFYNTNITSSSYSNRLTELTNAGWTY